MMDKLVTHPEVLNVPGNDVSKEVVQQIGEVPVGEFSLSNLRLKMVYY